MTALFLRLLPYDDKASALAEAVKAVREGHTLNSVVHRVDPASFRQVPGSPFAYWVSERIRRLFAEIPPFESEGRAVRVGLQTCDDFRFMRAWWEVLPEKILTGAANTMPEQFRRQTFKGKRWVPFAKGGEYSPYFADIPLLVDWENDGSEMKAFAQLLKERGFSVRGNGPFREFPYYFQSGLTFPRRTKRFCPRVLPSGVIFGHGGQTAFSPTDLEALLAIIGSTLSQFNVSLFLGTSPQDQGGTNPQFETGIIQRIPIAHFSVPKHSLRDLANQCISLSRNRDSAREISHTFHLTTLLQISGDTLAQRLVEWRRHIAEEEEQLTERHSKIDDIVFRLYGIEEEDRKLIEKHMSSEGDGEKAANEEEDTEEKIGLIVDGKRLVSDLLSYIIGCTLGRWDIRFATNESSAPKLPAPFAPLPVCSPGMLTSNDGLPLQKAPANYPISIDWDGILVDDPDHPDDIIRRVRDVLEIIWGDRAEAIEHETCDILDIKDLREYFRKPGNGGFWMDHVRRYSKSHRKAPIYWLLQSFKKNYALWLYYHQLDKDILFKALVNYVEPKLRLEESHLEQLRAQRASAGTSGREAKQLEKQLDRQETFLSELRDFHDKLRRAADLHLESDLNDGVVLNIAPLWELVPWNEAKAYWEELLAGKYEWSSIGKQLRETGLVGKG
jgi:hypothetical protein